MSVKTNPRRAARRDAAALVRTISRRQHTVADHLGFRPPTGCSCQNADR